MVQKYAAAAVAAAALSVPAVVLAQDPPPPAASGGSVTVTLPKSIGTEKELTYTYKGTSPTAAPGSDPMWRSWRFQATAYLGKDACPAKSTDYLSTKRTAVLLGNSVPDTDGPFTITYKQSFNEPGQYRLCIYMGTPGGVSSAPEQIVSQMIEVADTSFVPSGPGKTPKAGSWRATTFKTGYDGSKATFTVKGGKVGNFVSRTMAVFCPSSSGVGTIEPWPAAVVKKYGRVKKGRIKTVYEHKGGSVTFEGVFINATTFRGGVHVSTVRGCNGGLTFEAKRK